MFIAQESPITWRTAKSTVSVSCAASWPRLRHRNLHRLRLCPGLSPLATQHTCEVHRHACTALGPGLNHAVEHQRLLAGTVPADARQPWDVRTVLAHILDASEFQEFKALYGTSLLTGFGHLHGRLIGVLANNGVLQAESALKGGVF